MHRGYIVFSCCCVRITCIWHWHCCFVWGCVHYQKHFASLFPLIFVAIESVNYVLELIYACLKWTLFTLSLLFEFKLLQKLVSFSYFLIAVKMIFLLFNTWRRTFCHRCATIFVLHKMFYLLLYQCILHTLIFNEYLLLLTLQSLTHLSILLVEICKFQFHTCYKCSFCNIIASHNV